MTNAVAANKIAVAALLEEIETAKIAALQAAEGVCEYAITSAAKDGEFETNINYKMVAVRKEVPSRQLEAFVKFLREILQENGYTTTRDKEKETIRIRWC